MILGDNTQFQWCLVHGQWTVSKWERVNRASLPKVIIHYAESRRMCTSTISTLILHNCNKPLHNELHHIFPTSLTGFSSPPNQNLNLHKAARFNVKRGCRTNKTHGSKSLLHFCGEAVKTGEKDGARDRHRALIKHDCMIFQPQRGEHRKAHSQSSSWGSAQGKGNSNF